jgi:phosphate starvation-inducible protein PhoH
MARHKSSRRVQRNSQIISDTNTNIIAEKEGSNAKRLTRHDIAKIYPKTPNQQIIFDSFREGNHICMHGTAGSGKTFLSIFLALEGLLNGTAEFDNILIVRSAVATRDLGFMPGDLNEKIALFEAPYRDIVSSITGRDTAYDHMKKQQVMNFTSTSYIRGLTWDNTCIIVDEIQNMTFHEINSIITRIGINSRLILTGDTKQLDMKESGREKSGIQMLLSVLPKLHDFTTVRFTTDDIVRSEFVKRWIIATDNL